MMNPGTGPQITIRKEKKDAGQDNKAARSGSSTGLLTGALALWETPSLVIRVAASPAGGSPLRWPAAALIYSSGFPACGVMERGSVRPAAPRLPGVHRTVPRYLRRSAGRVIRTGGWSDHAEAGKPRAHHEDGSRARGAANQTALPPVPFARTRVHAWRCSRIPFEPGKPILDCAPPARVGSCNIL